MRLASSSWAANSSRVGARRRFDAKADVRARPSVGSIQGRFDLGDNSVGVLFVELMSALERRLATARGNAQPGRLLLYGLVALCGGDDHERNGAKRQETPRSATMRSTQLTCSGFLHPRGPGNSFSRSPVVGGPTSSKTTPATRAG